MVFKINISSKEGKTFKLESEAESLMGMSLGETIQGQEIMPELKGYEFKIAGASDKAGFTAMQNVEGIGLKKVLLTYGKAMHTRPRKEGKKKHTTMKPNGLRLRKTVRGKTISESISQINLKTEKQGEKPLNEVFVKEESKNDGK